MYFRGFTSTSSNGARALRCLAQRHSHEKKNYTEDHGASRLTLSQTIPGFYVSALEVF